MVTHFPDDECGCRSCAPREEGTAPQLNETRRWSRSHRIGGMTKRAAGALALIATILIGGAAGRQNAPTRIEQARDFFPIMPWEIQPEKQVFLDEPGHGIDSLRACGFNTVAFVRPNQLEKVEKSGMRAIVGRSGDLRVNWRAMSDQAIFDRVKGLVDESGESDAVIGYFLADEPGISEFPALGKAVAAVKQLAPG